MKEGLVGLVAGLLLSGAANAALVDLGGGQIEATGNGLVWLQNANLAATETFGVSGINANGTMDWYTAHAWIAAMNAENYLGHNNWMLPTTVQPDPSCSYQDSEESSGFNCTGSPMGELFYTEGGLRAGQSVLDSPALTSVFTNMQSDIYLSGTAYAPYPTSSVWIFYSFFGDQARTGPTMQHYVWALRPGDVAAGAAPEPATLALALAGSGLAGLARRRRSHPVQAA